MLSYPNNIYLAAPNLILDGINFFSLRLYLLFNRTPDYLIPSSKNRRVNIKKYTYYLI